MNKPMLAVALGGLLVRWPRKVGQVAKVYSTV